MTLVIILQTYSHNDFQSLQRNFYPNIGKLFKKINKQLTLKMTKKHHPMQMYINCCFESAWFDKSVLTCQRQCTTLWAENFAIANCCELIFPILTLNRKNLIRKIKFGESITKKCSAKYGLKANCKNKFNILF